MTPSEISPQQNKDLALTTDSQSDDHTDTDQSSPTNSVDDHHQTDGGDEYSLLPHSNPKRELIRHAVDENGKPVCGTVGRFRLVPLSQALEEADRDCDICKAVNNGGSESRPCPKCGRDVSLTHWPQHVRKCDGNPKSAGGDL